MEALDQFGTLVPELQRLVKNTDTTQLDNPTPCSEWVVRDLYAHLIGGAAMFAAAVRGKEPPAVEMPPDEGMAAAVVANADDLDDAFRSPGALERIIPTPFGDMPGDALARLLSFDVLMHMWDLATATGQTVEVPDELVAEVDGFARQAISPELRVPGVFAPEVEPVPGATRLERLAAFSGRSA